MMRPQPRTTQTQNDECPCPPPIQLPRAGGSAYAPPACAVCPCPYAAVGTGRGSCTWHGPSGDTDTGTEEGGKPQPAAELAEDEDPVQSTGLSGCEQKPGTEYEGEDERSLR